MTEGERRMCSNHGGRTQAHTPDTGGRTGAIPSAADGSACTMRRMAFALNPGFACFGSDAQETDWSPSGPPACLSAAAVRQQHRRIFYASRAVLRPDAAQPQEAIQMYEPPSAAPACGQAGSLGKPRFRFNGNFDTKAVNSAPGLDEPIIDGR